MSLVATAARLLKKHGVVVALSYELPGTSDPVSGEPVGAPAEMVFSGNGYPSNYKFRDVDGTNILASDIRLILEKIQEPPQKGWRARITSKGKTYRVMEVQEITDAGEDIIYICQLRAE